LVTFITLYFTGQTLNIMTMGGLALGVGRLVDDSIVELENIQRHLNTGQSRWEAVLEAAREVAMPIFASTVTTVVVFLRIFVLGFVGSLALVPLIGSEFVHSTDESQFRIIVRAPVGQRVEKTEQQVAKIEQVLRETIKPKELETVVSSVGVLQQGRSSLFNPNTGPHTALIQVYLVSPDKRTRNQIKIMNVVRH